MKRQVPAIVMQGNQVASGMSHNDCFVEDGGTIRLQAPLFKALGLDLEEYFGEEFVYGTINLSVDFHSFRVLRPKYEFIDLRWTHKLDVEGQRPYTETFWLDPAWILTDHHRYKALLYIPSAVTRRQYKPFTILEVIAQRIPNISYGDPLILEYDDAAIGFDSE